MENLQLHHYFKLTLGDFFVKSCDPSDWLHILADGSSASGSCC